MIAPPTDSQIAQVSSSNSGPQTEVSLEDLNKLRELARGSLFFFAKGILNFDWLVPDVHKPLCKLLEDDSMRKLKITLPRGWLKTTVCSIAFPLWLGIRDPNVRVLIVQNTFTNASKKLGHIRAIIERNPLFRALWPDLLPTKDSTWKTESLCLNRTKQYDESTFECAGTNTGVVSRHYDIIVEDDTVAPKLNELGEENLLPTKEDIVQAIGWHRLVPPLLNDLERSRNIVVGTRWFEKDLLSWIDENDPKFVSYSRAVREDQEGNPDESAKPAWPERFNDNVLEDLEISMGPYLFSCLYMNMPVSSTSMTFRPEWVKYYDEEPQDLAVYTTVDPASDPEMLKGKDPDYSVVMTTGKNLVDGKIYVLDYFMEKCNPGELTDAIFNHVALWSPIKVAVEAGAYQATLLYWLKERMAKKDKFFMVEPLTRGNKKKSQSIEGLQPVFASGNIFIRNWMKDLVSQLTSWPLGAHDDVVDALSMQLQLWTLTATYREERQRALGPSPLDFNHALKELLDRNNNNAGPLYDLVTPKRKDDPWDRPFMQKGHRGFSRVS